MAEIGETFLAPTWDAWRTWLAEHHATSAGIWLVLGKKSSGVLAVSLEEAVEEALCFGWIDSVQKPSETERSPGRRGSRTCGGMPRPRRVSGKAGGGYPWRMHILAIVGSLRRGSYNRMAYNAVRELLPEGVTIEEGEIGSIPLFNDDVLTESGPPEPVRRLREQIAAADAVLFISPEYNYSIPGVLKNAIDWVSRPATDQPLRGKPVAVLGAAKGALGTGRMQYHLRQVFVFLEAIALGKPEVMITFEETKFDAQGRLTDEPTRRVIRAQMEALVAWVQRLSAGS